MDLLISFPVSMYSDNKHNMNSPRTQLHSPSSKGKPCLYMTFAPELSSAKKPGWVPIKHFINHPVLIPVPRVRAHTSAGLRFSVSPDCRRFHELRSLAHMWLSSSCVYLVDAASILPVLFLDLSCLTALVLLAASLSLPVWFSFLPSLVGTGALFPSFD